jgi:hypothetical protein
MEKDNNRKVKEKRSKDLTWLIPQASWSIPMKVNLGEGYDLEESRESKEKAIIENITTKTISIVYFRVSKSL